MKPYTLDLRQKTLDPYDHKCGAQRALAALFGVSRAFLEQVLRRRHTTGEMAPRPHAGGRRRAVIPRPWRWCVSWSARDLRRVKFVDEASVNRAMTRLYGRAPQGPRVHGTVPLNYGANITLRGALGAEGLQTGMPMEGASDADVFRTDVRQVFGPPLAPGDSVVLDNLPAYKVPGIQPALARRLARRLSLPLYSPALSPMEQCLSTVKTAWRAAKARTGEALETTLQQAREIVTAIDAQNWFRHCGYALLS